MSIIYLPDVRDSRRDEQQTMCRLRKWEKSLIAGGVNVQHAKVAGARQLIA